MKTQKRRTYTITKEHVAELEAVLKTDLPRKFYVRIQSVMLKGKGYNYTEIKQITGASATSISTWTRTYVDEGLDALQLDRRKSNNYAMPKKKEMDFFQKHEERANKADIVTAEKLHEAYNKKADKPIKLNSFYKVLKRNGWSKKQPRKKHPKSADASTIEASKKLNPLSEATENASKE